MMASGVALVACERVLAVREFQLQNVVNTPQLLQLVVGVACVPCIIVMTVSVRFRGNGSRTVGLLHYF